ncbi:hypothetical protein PIB30_043290 [Stylosanthes scabra]|uniref:Uncharacterized protein n=1 Tax=Stylosanthes scabra TaxID=79078 RepID=A0ABU6YCU5_9FABA|nr:hypothetical protein [Stylosanthes scabra]
MEVRLQMAAELQGGSKSATVEGGARARADCAGDRGVEHRARDERGVEDREEWPSGGGVRLYDGRRRLEWGDTAVLKKRGEVEGWRRRVTSAMERMRDVFQCLCECGPWRQKQKP